MTRIVSFLCSATMTVLVAKRYVLAVALTLAFVVSAISAHVASAGMRFP